MPSLRYNIKLPYDPRPWGGGVEGKAFMRSAVSRIPAFFWCLLAEIRHTFQEVRCLLVQPMAQAVIQEKLTVRYSPGHFHRGLAGHDPILPPADHQRRTGDPAKQLIGVMGDVRSYIP